MEFNLKQILLIACVGIIILVIVYMFMKLQSTCKKEESNNKKVLQLEEKLHSMNKDMNKVSKATESLANIQKNGKVNRIKYSDATPIVFDQELSDSEPDGILSKVRRSNYNSYVPKSESEISLSIKELSECLSLSVKKTIEK